MKQTAVEWLIEQLEKVDYNPLEKGGYDTAKKRIIEQAKAIEKEQICNAYTDGVEFLYLEAEQYYNETFTQSHMFERKGTSHECKICGQHEHNHYTK